jgi:tetratricopeptide (TPR) repeat protein
VRPFTISLLLAASLQAAPALAQVAAPSMVVEDLQQDEPARPPPEERAPGEAPRDRAAPPNPESGAQPQPQPSAAVAPAPTAAVSPKAARPEPPAVEVRAIEPVRARLADVEARWLERRRALREQDLPTANAAQKGILAALRELGIENLLPEAAAEAREAERSLASRAPADAVAHAELATQLAPDLTDAWLALAHARLVRDPGQPLAALEALRGAAAAALREPHSRRALFADLLGAALVGLVAAASLLLLVLFARTLRLFLHDFHHLPVVRGGAAIQASFLALVLLSLPVVFRLGPLALLATCALAAFLYLSLVERLLATAALALVIALPSLTALAARATAFAGTLAEEVWELEHGGGAEEAAARLAARSEAESLPAPALLALGRWEKRRGDLGRARAWYDKAAAADPRSAAVQVNLGNVSFLEGDLEAAKAAYLAAADRAGPDVTTLAAAHYDLSKLYVRQLALEQAQEARKRAVLEDHALIDRYGSDDDFHANRYLVDVPLSPGDVDALADPGPQPALRDAVRARLARWIPGELWPWAPAGFVALLWALALAGRRLAPCHTCEKCGRPACRRCDDRQAALCGQCVNVFVQKGVVDVRDRLRKEAQVRWHARVRAWTARALAVVGGGAGHVYAGRSVRGALYLAAFGVLAVAALSWRGVLPPAVPSPYAPPLKLAVALPLAALVHLAAVRDALRKGRR